MTADMAAKIAQMQTKRTAPCADIWQNDNGTWSHRHDGQRQWADKVGCQTDFRFSQDWYRGRA